MKRYLDDRVSRDLAKKMVFLVGPRQVGKTTLSQALLQTSDDGQYLNYDVAEDRRVIENQSWNKRSPLLVLDEIHKMPLWKSWLKGVYDGKPPAQRWPVGSLRCACTPSQYANGVSRLAPAPSRRLPICCIAAASPNLAWRKATRMPTAGEGSTLMAWCAMTCWSSPAFRR